MLRWSLRALTLLGLSLVVFEGHALFSAHRSLQQRIAPYQSGSSVLTKAQLAAIVKVQDPAFFSHGGIEWPSPLTTTTITQSVVKRLFFQAFRPGFQKLEQTLIAWWVVNPKVSKDAQLRAFTETAYLGQKNGRAITGFEEAAKAWFGLPLPSLATDQFLSLLAMLPAPNTLTPGSAESAKRVARIKLVLDGSCVHTRVADIWLEQCTESRRPEE
jgi:monofunctional glycosyltransferase